MSDIKFLWLIHLFELRIDLIFQCTLKELVCKIYLHLEYNFYHTCTEKNHLSEDITNSGLSLKKNTARVVAARQSNVL